MELRHLRYFVAVGETENFSQASERLHVVQSAISRQVRELEIELGCDLFVRHGKRVKLSDFGRGFLDQARSILADVERARSYARLSAEGQRGCLRVAVQVPAFDRALVRDAIKSFKNDHPAVDLELVAMRGDEVIEAVHRGQMDLGLVYSPGQLDDIRFRTIAREKWLLTMPRDHRLAAHEAIQPADLRNEPFIWLPRHVSPRLHDRILAHCHANDLVPRIVQFASDRLLLLGLIEAGIGLCFLPGPLAPTRARGLVQCEVAGFDLPAEVGLISASGEESILVQKFASYFKEV